MFIGERSALTDAKDRTVSAEPIDPPRSLQAREVPLADPSALQLIGCSTREPSGPRAASGVRPNDDSLASCPIQGGHTVRLRGDPGPFEVKLKTRRLGPGVDEVVLRLRADAESPLPQLALQWSEPLTDGVVLWRTSAFRNKRFLEKTVDADAVTSKATLDAPVVSVIGDSGENCLTFGWSDAVNVSHLKANVVEETKELDLQVGMFDGEPAPVDRIEARLRIDRRPIRYEQVLQGMTTWFEAMPALAPSPVPEEAFLPVLQTWCLYHKDIDFEALDLECEKASELGLKALYIDDGWQLDPGDVNAGVRDYAKVGDWSPNRMAELGEFVKRQQERGMAVALWMAPALAGFESETYARFRDEGMLLYEQHDPWRRCGILDPRYAEVRTHLADTFVRVMRETGCDGFKIDFLNEWKMMEGTPRGTDLAKGRDFASLNEAVDQLMSEIMERLREVRREAGKGEPIREFRLPYFGPLMRKHGNVFRAWDCPLDPVQNRVQVTDLRHLNGTSATHADMIEIHPDAQPDAAALQILSVLFAVPQISNSLVELPPGQERMLRFWMGFWHQHRDTLLFGEFRASSPESNYPLLSASSTKERIVAAYDDLVVELAPPFRPEIHLVNATRREKMWIDLERDLGPRLLRVFDAEGTMVREEPVALEAGPHRIEVPPAGLASLVAVEEGKKR